jgi:Cu+-exporting ATPase
VVTDIVVNGSVAERDLLAVAVSLEARSEHALAKAILEMGRERGIEPAAVEGFEAVSGLGARGRINGEVVLLGNRRFMENEGAGIAEIGEKGEALLKSGKTCVFVASGGVTRGIIALADSLKDSAKGAVSLLEGMGLNVSMLTGDRRETAEFIGRQAGIQSVMAEVLPGDKAGQIKRLQAQGEVVAMVGDGINDAPALAAADVGIAIGAGTDVAVEASDITLVRDDLRLVASAMRLSFLTMRVIKQNLFWAFFYNTLGIPVAAGALYPFFGILLNPMFAAAAMAMSSVSVVGNALRLRRLWARQGLLGGGAA